MEGKRSSGEIRRRVGMEVAHHQSLVGADAQNVRCKSLDLIHRSMSDYAIHRTASMIGETASILSRTRAWLAPAKPVLRILDRVEPLAKLAAMR